MSGPTRLSGGLALLSVFQLRGHALTYLAGGPTIAILTGLLAAVLTIALAAASTRWVEEPLMRRRDRPLLVGATR